MQYKHNKNNKDLWLYIPYAEEVVAILNFLHYNNNHLKRDSMLKKIKEMVFSWNGMTANIEDSIHKYGVCYSISNTQKLSKKPKIIITYGPFRRYQADIWYLLDDLKIGHDFLYVLDIIDHYSKWLYSFLLKNNSADMVLSKIKLFININGPSEIFQTDNGGEFVNL